MDDGHKSALRRHHAELRSGIKVNNLLPDLHCAARGFLTDVERDEVSSKSCNVSQVDALIEILLTKENKDFDSFCRVLEKGKYRWWSEVLSQSASSTKRGMILTAESKRGLCVGICEWCVDVCVRAYVYPAPSASKCPQ